jgi:hypothetical protein
MAAPQGIVDELGQMLAPGDRLVMLEVQLRDGPKPHPPCQLGAKESGELAIE